MAERFAFDMSHLRSALAAAACLVLGGATVWALRPAPQPAPASAPAPAPAPPAVRTVVVPVELPMPIPVPPARAHSLDLHFVIAAGSTSYMALADLGDDAEAMPRHAAAHLIATDGVDATAVARVADRNVPLAYRGWLGKSVVVDGGCTAKVTGFAVVARLDGWGEEKWTANATLEQGASVLAARLDRCTGTYARDAALPPVIAPVAVGAADGAALAARAKARLVASAASRDAQRAWSGDFGQTGRWYDHVPITVQLVRYPGTGAIWAAVHADQLEGCGGANIDLLGLYRVAPDGTLTTVAERTTALEGAITLLDVDGDGTPELLGRPWLDADHLLEAATGAALATSALPFLGCPC